MRRVLVFVFTVAAIGAVALTGAQAADCSGLSCDKPSVGTGAGVLVASYLERNPGGSWVASNAAPIEHPYTYQLSHPCVVDDRENGGCRPSDTYVCAAPPDRVIDDLVIERRRLAITDPAGSTTTVDGFSTGGAPVGTPVGPWEQLGRGCVDVTALNPPPSPDEVFRYFQQLPLPQLPTQQQPPGDALVGLPVIFYTDGPTTQTFTLDIRGFTVDIAARATGFTWHTGDGTQLTSTSPGAPYPDHTISHDYRSGSYSASLTTTWTATFSVDGGASVPVPGSTTTEGPPVAFDVLQARPVLTNPYD